jgi:hypothetical protein
MEHSALQHAEQALSVRVRNELTLFRAACQRIPSDPSQTSPLEWWSDNFHRFPTLSELARLIFSIPGSQIECERIFSAAGLITSGLRNRLGVENLDMLVNIQNNADIPRHIKEALCAAHGAVLGEKIFSSSDLKFKSETTFINEELGVDDTRDPNLNLVYGALDALLENLESIDENTDGP